MVLHGWAFVVGLSMLTGAPASALDEARDAYLRGDFERASEAFARAYAEDPRPEFVYAQAQSERQAGRCDRAVHLYVRFLELAPEGPDAVKASQNLLHCQTELLHPRKGSDVSPREPASPPTITPGSQRKPTPGPKPDAVPPPVIERDTAAIAPPTQPAKRRAPAWIRDPVGDALVSVGLVGAVTGAALLGVARRDRDRAESAANLGEYRDRIEHDIVLERAGLVLLPAGSAFILGGVIRWIVVARRERIRARAAVASDRRASVPSPRDRQ